MYDVCLSVVMLFRVCSTMVLGNDMGMEGAKALSRVLGRLTKLTKLYLGGE